MRRDTILIVDDMEINRTILSGLFSQDYHLLEAEDGEQALSILNRYHSKIAVMLLDVVMPVKDGYQVLEEIGANGLLSEVPVVVITADDSLEGELRAFDLGASDIIVKPFEPHVVKKRVQNIIELYLHKHNLEDLVDKQASKLRASNDVLIDALSSVIEYKSLESGQHIRRIRLLSKILLKEVQRTCPEYGLTDKKIDTMASASAMHDIGKIAIPDHILNKPGRLTPEEFEIMKTHALKGCEILETLDGIDDKEYLKYAYNICRYHHERWDGKGYPDGLYKDAIPICAQVVGIVDAYDALTSDRVYKKAIKCSVASDMILNGECGTFSPKLLECFKRVRPQLAELAQKYADVTISSGHRTEESTQPPALRDDGLSSFELGQMKYYAMLRYENATIAEADFATGEYHSVYSAGTDFKTLNKATKLEDALHKYVEDMVHPGDKDKVIAIWKEELPRFFNEGSFKQSWRHRSAVSYDGEFDWYEMTVLRIDTENPQRRKALLLWKAVEGKKEREELREKRKEKDSTVLSSIFEGVIKCKNDQWLTITHMEDGVLDYNGEDIKNKLQGRYINMIMSDDRERFRKQLTDQLNRGDSYELECRVTWAEGNMRWMLAKGRLFTDEDGREYLCNVLIDVDRFKRAEEQLKMSLERYRMITEQTNDIIFEWDLTSDHMEYSPNWKRRYGYTPVTENAGEMIPKTSHLHPDDLEIVKEFIEEIRLGRKYGELEFRISDVNGRYRWSRARVTAQLDNTGKPYKAIGVLIDINEEKIEAQKLLEKAERDVLTKLYNRDSARQRIEQQLSQRGIDETSALFLIDLDNFKLVNDRYGHLFGDAVLTKISSQLSQMFRTQDIVARVGGDEFMAMIQGDFDEGHITEAAKRIIDRFYEAFKDLPQDCHVSCSIGIAVCPKDGSDFQTLFRKADIALYKAKAAGKKQFQFYDDDIDRSSFNISKKRTEISQVDSQYTDNMFLQLSDLIPSAFNTLNEASDLNKAVNTVLEMVGKRLGVSRTYVFENSEDNLYYTNTFEWCNDGIEPQKDTLQNLAYEDLDSDYPGYFNEKGILYCTDIAIFSPKIQEMLREQDVKAMLQCAIRDEGVFRGWVGFDDCEDEHMWTVEQIEILTFIAELLSVFLLKKKAQERAIELAQDFLTVLDHQNSWIYIVDPDTYKLLFINAKTHSLVPTARKEMLCYKAFMDRDEPCVECPMRGIEQSVNKTMEIYNPVLKVWTLADAALIRWQNKSACLLSCHDVTPYKEKE